MPDNRAKAEMDANALSDIEAQERDLAKIIIDQEEKADSQVEDMGGALSVLAAVLGGENRWRIQLLVWESKEDVEGNEIGLVTEAEKAAVTSPSCGLVSMHDAV